MFKRKKKQDEVEDLSIVDDYKEPFSWRNFWDEQVVGRIKTIQAFLKKNGILFFLMSPFQYRNRLITKLVIIVIGVLIGIVPRTVNLISQARERNAASELSTTVMATANRINVSPLMSSQAKDKHVLAFSIDGDTEDGVPSTTRQFKVKLMPARGNADVEKVKYGYKVIPVSSRQRLLVVFVDTSKQNDNTGIFDMDVHIKGDKKMREPLEVVLSKGQDTTKLYAGDRIHLSALSNPILKLNDASATTIAGAQKELAKAMDSYKINEERLTESGFKVSLSTDETAEMNAFEQPKGMSSYEYLEELNKLTTVMPSLTDKSTTDDISKLDSAVPAQPVVTPTLTDKSGKRYINLDDDGNVSDGDMDGSSNAIDAKADKAQEELSTLSDIITKIQQAVSMVNAARTQRYRMLADLDSALGQTIEASDFTNMTKVVDD